MTNRKSYTGFPASHQPRFYAALNFLKMGIKLPTFVVFWTISTIKDEKSAASAKYHYITRRPASADRTARAANFRRAGLIGDVGL